MKNVKKVISLRRYFYKIPITKDENKRSYKNRSKLKNRSGFNIKIKNNYKQFYLILWQYMFVKLVTIALEVKFKL